MKFLTQQFARKESPRYKNSFFVTEPEDLRINHTLPDPSESDFPSTRDYSNSFLQETNESEDGFLSPSSRNTFTRLDHKIPITNCNLPSYFIELVEMGIPSPKYLRFVNKGKPKKEEKNLPYL